MTENGASVEHMGMGTRGLRCRLTCLQVKAGLPAGRSHKPRNLAKSVTVE